MAIQNQSGLRIALLTGGSDKPYVFGITTELLSKGIDVDLIGSDELDCPEYRREPRINFLNLRGSQRTDVGLRQKVTRILGYYFQLMSYAAKTKQTIFHILWNNKFETFDRTFLTLYYKILGKKLVFTAHNVNAARRDSRDSFLNRLTLRIQYSLLDHIFVHTEKMKSELVNEFGVHASKATVIPFGINNAVPNTSLTPQEARKRLGLGAGEKVILFFGRITPYKGVESLHAAFRTLLERGGDYRLLIAGRPNCSEEYWTALRESLKEGVRSGRIILRSEYIPDEETEVYFKAADILALPYTGIYQSGVLFLAHSFGLPVVANDIGSFRDDIVEGTNGYLVPPGDSVEMANTLERYFSSRLYANLDSQREGIRLAASEAHSWDTVGRATVSVYASLLRMPLPGAVLQSSESTCETKTSS